MTVPIPSKVSNSPVFNDTMFLDNSGKPLAGGFIYTYEAGGFTALQGTFTDHTGTVENTNPIQLDSSGRLQTGLWLADGYSYNLTLCDASNTVLESQSNISGVFAVPSGGGIGTVIWNVPPIVPEFVSSTQFRLSGLFVVEFAQGNRVRYQFNDLSYGYAVVSAVVYSDPYTYVTIVPDSVVFSSLVFNVAWSALVVANYTVDAGAVGYTAGFTYSGANVGTQLQATNTLLSQYQRSYPAVLSGGNYSVTAAFNPTSYTGMTLDVIFDAAYDGPTTINVNNIGIISLKIFDYMGNLVDPEVVPGWCSRLMYNGTVMVMLDQLPYTPPTPPPPAFAVTSGTVNAGGTFTVTAGPSGYIAVTVSNYCHALYANWGEVNFQLFANGTLVHTAYTRFFEWDSRTGGGNPTNVAAINLGAGVTVSFHLVYSGSGTPFNPSEWMAITS